MLRENFDIKVAIKEELKKKLVLGLQARLPIGMILGFIGYRKDILSLMQELNHGTRAYIWNEDGLKGFVLELPGIIPFLKNARKDG